MSTTKSPIFFVGGRYRGYLLIKEFIKKRENLVGAFIMREDAHENEKYSDTIAEILDQNKIPYIITNNINKERYRNYVKEKNPFLIIVMGWRTIISDDITTLPKYGTVALHESLLPAYRGFAPINWQIINGERKTGVTLFYIANDIDNGDIVGQKTINIDRNDSAYDIYKKTSHASIALVKKYLPLLKKDACTRRKQNEKQATFTCVRLPEDGLINWNDSSEAIYNLVRGLSYPYPGAFSLLAGKKMTIWKASIPSKRVYVGRIPGRVVKIIPGKGVEVLTGDSIILLEDVQLDGKEKAKASSVITSIRITIGR